MTRKGDWLSIGGASGVGFGVGRIEVRIADNDDGTLWHWRNISDDERAAILQLMSARQQVPTR